MSDIHVVALYYDVKAGDGTDYEIAAPLEYEHAKFRVEVKDGLAKFEMKGYFVTQERAIECVLPFIRSWEVQSDLTSEPESFRLKFHNSQVIDRDPSPRSKSVVGSAAMLIDAFVSAGKGLVKRSSYPEPPHAFAVDANVETMAMRYCWYRQGREPLASMAYFCLTVIEMMSVATGNKNRQRRRNLGYRRRC